MIIFKVLSYDDYFQGTVFQTVIPVAYNPRTVSWVTTASLSIAFQAIPRYVTGYDSLTGWSLITNLKFMTKPEPVTLSAAGSGLLFAVFASLL